MNNPKVSVIIPVYNAERYLKQCLDSIINQTLKEIEIICVDDGSTDSSLEILKKYEKKDGRVQIIQQKNQFAGVARNNGLKIARGKYVFFIDSDDFCEISLLNSVFLVAEKNNVDIVAFDHYLYDEKNKTNKRIYDVNYRNIIEKKNNIFNYKDFPTRIMSSINPVPWNKLIKKALIEKWNLTFEDISSTNDVTFAALCSVLAEKIYYISKPLITHRTNLNDSITSTKISKKGNVITALVRLYDKTIKIPYYEEIKVSLQVFCASNLRFALNNYSNSDKDYDDFFKEVGRIFFGLPLFYDINKNLINDESLYNFIINAEKKVETEFSTKYFPEIVVSLTSYPKRINTVYKTIETLLKQTVKPNKIILWLAIDEFPDKEKNLPLDLLSLKSDLFNIKWCDNIRSYKKLIPSLELYPDSIIITVDDDLLFNENMIKNLLIGYREKPYCIQCHRVTTVEYKSIDNIKTYASNTKVYPFPTYVHKLSGGAGCLYPPHCLYSDVIKKELFMKLAPTSDDIWFWLMGVLNGFRVNVVKNNFSKLSYIPGTQEVGLYHINDSGEKLFFVHLKNILYKYPVVKDILIGENKIIEHYEIESQEKLVLQRKENEMDSSKLSNEDRKNFGCFIYRFFKGGIKCYKEHGIKYTFNRIIFHLKNVKAKVVNDVKVTNNVRTTNNIEAGNNVKVTNDIKVKRDYFYYKNLPVEKYEEALKEWFFRVTKEKLDLETPKTYNEKIQWLKLYDNTPLKTKLADKYLVREYVKDKIGERYLVPLLGVWDSFDEINFDNLPNSFVLKANHGCGWNIIVKDKSKFDKTEAKKKFDEWLQINFAYKFGLELQYKNIKPKIIAESYMENNNNDLYDYKVFCFNGKAESIMFLSERKQGLKMAFFDLQWNKLPFTYSFPRNEEEIPRPQNLNLLISLSEKLAQGFAHVRVDFYILNDGSLKFGELTFSSASGTCKWNPSEQNKIYGDLIQLPMKKPIPQKMDN